MPPGMPAKTGSSLVGRSATASRSDPPRGQQRDQLGGGRAGGQQPRVPGVHAAEQRLDQAVDDLVAEPRCHQVAHGEVVARARWAAAWLGPNLRQTLVAEHTRRGEAVDVERDPHQRARQRPELAAGPEPRRRGRRVDDLEPELPRQLHALGRRLSIASAPTSTVTPATSASRSLPPTCGSSRGGGRRGSGPRR